MTAHPTPRRQPLSHRVTMMPRCDRQAITCGHGGAVIRKRLIGRTNRVAARKHVRVGMIECKSTRLLNRGLRKHRGCNGGCENRSCNNWNELRHGEYPFDCGTSPMWAPQMRKSGGCIAYHCDVRNRAQSVHGAKIFPFGRIRKAQGYRSSAFDELSFPFRRDASRATGNCRAAMPAADNARSSAVRARAPSSSAARRSGYAPLPGRHWGRRRSRSEYR